MFIAFVLIMNLRGSAQINEVDVSSLLLSSEDFSKILNLCMDSIGISNEKYGVAYQLNISNEFVEPRVFDDMLDKNSFLVKAYLNFSLDEIDFQPTINGKLKLKKAKAYFDWPVIDITSNNIFFRIKTFSGQYLTEYFFKIKRSKCEIHIIGLATTLSMVHVPLEVLKSKYGNKEFTKDDIQKLKVRMDSMARDLKSIATKKDTTI